MPRDLPTAVQDAVDEPVVRPFFAVRLELADPVYAWTGSGTLIFADNDGTTRNWIGAGSIGSIDPIGETTDGSATGIKVTLLNAPSEFSDDIEAQAQRGALYEIYFGALNETYQQVEGVVLIWKGRLDTYDITDSGTTITVELAGESRAIDQRRPAIKRFTDEYQQREFPGDLFFQYVPQMTEIQILWDKAELGTAAVGGSGVGGTGSGAGLSLSRQIGD